MVVIELGKNRSCWISNKIAVICSKIRLTKCMEIKNGNELDGSATQPDDISESRKTNDHFLYDHFSLMIRPWYSFGEPGASVT